MTDDNRNDTDDDSYVIEDTGESIEDIEHEMEIAANEAAGNSPSGQAPAAPVALDEEAREFKDRYLRTLADFENYRKRADREKSDFYKYALQSVLKELLPVLDNFDRALDHAEQGDDFHRGVALIYKQLLDTLRKHGVTPIDESGVKFNPNIHEAVMSEEDTSVPAQTVTLVMQKGYSLHDRLLRPAMVKVAVGGPEQA